MRVKLAPLASRNYYKAVLDWFVDCSCDVDMCLALHMQKGYLTHLSPRVNKSQQHVKQVS